jgi:Cu-processing system permease protein
MGLSGEREDGTLGYLLAQPIGRTSVYLAKLAGQWISLTFAIGCGLGLAGLVVGWNAGLHDAFAYGILALVAVLLGASSLGVGVLVAVASASRMRALATALLLWVLFGFVIDLASIGLVVATPIAPSTFLFLSFANPVQLAKILCLLALSQKLEVLGPAGIYAVKTFGQLSAGLLIGSALLAWAVVPGTIGWMLFRRMNVR